MKLFKIVFILLFGLSVAAQMEEGSANGTDPCESISDGNGANPKVSTNNESETTGETGNSSGKDR